MASKLNHYIGSYANDAAADAIISANSWIKAIGVFYQNTTSSRIRFWDGTQWSELGTGGGGIAQWTEDRIIYFGKHGNDGQSGKAVNLAKLTIGAAITAAAALVPAPSTSNPAAVVCLDGGTYAENVVTQPAINVYSPNAVLNGSLTLADDADVTLFRIDGVSPVCVVKNSGTSASKLDCHELVIPASSAGILNLGLNAIVMAEIKQLFVGQNSFGIGDISSGIGHMHVEVEDIYLDGASAVGIARGGAGTTVGNVTHILERGLGIGAGVAINAFGGEVDLSVETISANIAYTVQAGAELNLRVNKFTGNTVLAAGADARVMHARAVPITGSGNPDGSVIGFNGQIYTDTANSVMYVCESQPSGTAWRVI